MVARIGVYRYVLCLYSAHWNKQSRRRSLFGELLGLDEEVLWWGIGTFDGNLPGRRLTFPYSSGIQILQLGR